MTFATEWREYSDDYENQLPPLRARPQRALAGVAFACVATACAWTLYANLTGPDAPQSDFVDSGSEQSEAAATRGDKLVAATRDAAAVAGADVSKAYAWLLDPRFTAASQASTFAVSAVMPAVGRFEAAFSSLEAQTAQAAAPAVAHDDQTASLTPPAQPVTAPPPRPQPRIAAVRVRAQDVAAKQVDDKPTLFERLFGRTQQPTTTLAYAAPDAGGLGEAQNVATGLYDRSTAVYDISARVVYMPDGSRLEAHSGLGSLLDDPRYADRRDRGVTPPTVYDLQERESLFHGVRALRLIPEDESKVFGRSGLLAHSFMLGPNGDSNGCVSFRNYEAFLHAYLNHEIKRLAVVARLD